MTTGDPKKPCPLGERIVPLEPLREGEVSIAVRHHDNCDHDFVLVTPRKKDEPLPEGALGRASPLGDGTYRPSQTGHAGPARVTSDAYRGGCERLFGGRQEVGQA